jgi:hypothetical protein
MRDCADCERLWREYAAATTEHIKVMGKQRIAHLRHDAESERDLDAKVKAAELSRASTRTAIQEHEAITHDETAEGKGRLPHA